MRMRVGMEERGRAADAHPALACAHLGYEETGLVDPPFWLASLIVHLSFLFPLLMPVCPRSDSVGADDIWGQTLRRDPSPGDP